ncbi:DNA phosphorothioation-dependent restriction protein DptF [Paenibacillus sp.]|uniref:DNA phosphorothioation-dependent restriction protein DptF n=1 Tax=Paenibacillus sp. TaxID=58172 RepID=UPI002D6772D9|nr:DNA phosphorothioation-dependent restriction protein DptF [Paenibacillus sp.]HZG86235.1 DNA phosphorothioation-dependent restriction protein DptF [Paenibacillus sp.]
MTTNKSSLVQFIEQWNDELATLIYKMETLIYQDPASAMLKARVFVEEILQRVFQTEGIILQENLSLHDKISLLSTKEYITKETQSLLHTVRLAGNKAAHNANYDDLSEAIKLHRAVYMIFKWYYETYLSFQSSVPDYAYPKPPSENSEEIQQLKAEVMKIMEMVRAEQAGKLPMTEESVEMAVPGTNPSLLQLNLPAGHSYLLREMKRLRDSSKEAIENANAFSKYKEYLHVERKVQIDLEECLRRRKDSPNSNLILLCGNVGDGKSHLLAYLKENRPELLEKYEVFNDATESFSPTKDAMETLDEILRDFSDERIATSGRKVILAINMGILHNFISSKSREGVTYSRLERNVNESGLFSNEVTQTNGTDDYFDILSFSDYHPYEITANGAESSFYTAILEKVFAPNEGNPFYLAYKEDLTRNVKTMLHENYLFMQNPTVRKQVVQFITQAIIQYKLVVSARAFLNFIADIVVPDDMTPFDFMGDLERMEQSVPTLMFKRRERSFILRVMHELDPIHKRNEHTDNIIIELNTSSNWSKVVEAHITNDVALRWLKVFQQSDEVEFAPNVFSLYCEFIIRLAELTNPEFYERTSSKIYKKYLKLLFGVNVGEKEALKTLYEETKEAIHHWRGSPLRDYVYINKPTDMIRIAQRLQLKPDVSHITQLPQEKLEKFRNTIKVAYRSPDQQSISLEIDYPLFELLQKVLNGYCPNKKDEEDAVNFVEFVERLMRLGEKKKELLVHFPQDSRMYKLYKDDFSGFVFEKE